MYPAYPNAPMQTSNRAAMPSNPMGAVPQALSPALPPSMQTNVQGGIGDLTRQLPSQSMASQQNPWLSGSLPNGNPFPAQSGMPQDAPQGPLQLPPTAQTTVAPMMGQNMNTQSLYTMLQSKAPQAAARPMGMAQGGSVGQSFDDYLMRLRGMR